MSRRRSYPVELLTNVAALEAGGGTPPPPLLPNLFSCSMWINFTSASITNQATLWVVDPQGVYSSNAFGKFIAGGNDMEFQMLDAAGDTNPNLTYLANMGAVNTWVHLLFSCDTQAVEAACYVNGVAIGTFTPRPPFDMAFESLPFWIFNDTFGAWEGLASEFWIAPGQSLLVSGDIPPGTVAKFYNGGHPVNLGADGSTPTGVAPLIYLHMPSGGSPSAFATNNGTGGAFTETGGSLTTAGSSPSDGGGAFAVGAVNLDGNTYLVNSNLG